MYLQILNNEYEYLRGSYGETEGTAMRGGTSGLCVHRSGNETATEEQVRS